MGWLTGLAVVHQVPDAKTARIAHKEVSLCDLQALGLARHCHLPESGMPLLGPIDLEEEHALLEGRRKIMLLFWLLLWSSRAAAV